MLGTLLKQVCVLPIRMARSGQDALDQVRERLPAIIFLDIDLPDLNGLELLRRIPGQDDHTPSWSWCQGIGTPGNVKDSREHGAVAFILKPLEATESAGGLDAVSAPQWA